MRDASCPHCGGRVWARDVFVAEAGAGGDVRVTRVRARGPLRWTCARCGYAAPTNGLMSWQLDDGARAESSVAAG